MARLADYWLSSDDELPHRHTRSTQKSGSAQDRGRTSVSSIATPVKRDLVPKSTTTASTLKVRRLASRGEAADNPLFQPWNARDDTGTQARSQTTMRESPAKLGLITEFERDSPPATTRPSRTKPLDLVCPASGFESDSEIFTQSILFPATAKKQNPRVSDIGPDSTRIIGINYGRKAYRNSRPSSDVECTDEGSFDDGLATEYYSSGVTFDDTVADERLNYTCNGNHDKSSSSKPNLSTRSETLLPDNVELIPQYLNAEDSAMERKHAETKRVGPHGPLKLIDGNVPSPNRPSTKPNYEPVSPGKHSATKHVHQPNEDNDILTMLKQMRIDSEDVSAGDHVGNLEELPNFVTLPSSPPTILSSPRKHHPVSRTPHGPGVSSLWNQDFVDAWKSELSHQEQLQLTLQAKQSRETINKTEKRDFEAKKQDVAERFLSELDLQIANGQIAALSETTGGVKIIWTKSLKTTAGRANWRRETVRTKQPDGSFVEIEHKHHASIDLADKVIDDEGRLFNVLAHEFCHLATFMISGVTTNPHGKEFKSWASKCSRTFADRGIQVTTKHSYEIDYKYKWECSQCGIEYKRHSRSIDTQRHRCGSCKGELKQIKPTPRTNTSNGVSEYQQFVKKQMKLVKRDNPHVQQRDVFRIVAQRWADSKKAADDHISYSAGKESGTDDSIVATKFLVDLTLDD